MPYPQTKEAWVELLRTDVTQFNAAHQQFREAHPLRRLDLMGVNLSGIRCYKADLSSTDLDRCFLGDSKFEDCNFFNASFKEATSDAMVHFAYCNMVEASFIKTTLTTPIFDDCELNGAKFRRAVFTTAGFNDTQVGHANLHKSVISPMSTFEGTRFQNEEQARLFAARHPEGVDAQPVVEPAPQPGYDAARAQRMIVALRQWLDNAPLPGSDQAPRGEEEDIPTFSGSNHPTYRNVIDSITFAPGDADTPPRIILRVTDPLYRMGTALAMALQKAGRYSLEDMDSLAAVGTPNPHDITLSPFELEKLISAIDTPETAEKITQDFHEDLDKYHRIRLGSIVHKLSEAFRPKEEIEHEPEIHLTAENFKDVIAQMGKNLEAAKARAMEPLPDPIWTLVERHEAPVLVTDDPVGKLSGILQAAGLPERQAQLSSWQKAGKTYLSLDAARTLCERLEDPKILESIQQARQNVRG